MNWAKDSDDTGNQFNSRTTSYKSQIKKIEEYNNLNSILPQTKKLFYLMTISTLLLLVMILPACYVHY